MSRKVRCTNCRGYMDRSNFFWEGPNGLGRICTEQCYHEWKDRKKPSPREVKANRQKKAAVKPGIPTALRLEIRNRDRNVCRWCQQPGRQVHHIHYRSEGGPDEPENLILLCVDCHERAHSSKKAYKPVLLTYIDLFYKDGVQLTIPQVARFLDSTGDLSDLQRERLEDDLIELSLEPADM